MGLEISNTTIRIADLALTSSTLDGLIAKNVTFVGPAVVAILPGTMNWTNVRIGEQIDAVLWDIDDQRQTITGAIGFSNSDLTDCVFTQVGFALQRVNMPKFISMIQV